MQGRRPSKNYGRSEGMERERDRERERDKEIDREREKERERESSDSLLSAQFDEDVDT